MIIQVESPEHFTQIYFGSKNPEFLNHNIPHIGNIPSVMPRAAEKANCLCSAPLNKNVEY